MDDELRSYLIGSGAAQVALFGMLVDHLDRRGLMSRDEFAAELKEIVRLSGEQYDIKRRVDMGIIAKAIDWLESSSNNATRTPTDG